MATEQQELELRVTLDDQATAQLQQIKQTLSGLGGSGSGSDLSQITGRISEFDRALGSLTRSALGVGKASMELAKVIGPMPVALGVLAYQTIRTSEAAKSWGEQMQATANAARMAGINFGEFKEIVSSLKTVGLSAEGAGNLLAKFSRAYTEVMMVGSQRREQLLQIAGPEFAGNMFNAIEHLRGLTTASERLKYVYTISNNAFRNEMARSGDQMLAAYKRDQVLMIFDSEELNGLRDFALRQDKLSQENMAWEAKKFEELTDAQADEAYKRGRIADITKTQLAVAGTWLLKQTDFVAGPLVEWLEKQEELVRTSQITWIFGGVNQGSPFGKAATATGATTVGAGAAAAYHDFFMGNKATGTKGLTERVMEGGLSGIFGGGSKPAQTTEENTKELQRLSGNVQKLLVDPKTTPLVPKKYAKGGVIKGPTKALVGEKGPEAIVGEQGSTVVTKPTITTLGGDQGTQTVIPLNPDGSPKLGAFADQKDRPAHYEAQVSIGGETFRGGSGMPSSPSLPYGVYSLTNEIGATGHKKQAIAGISDILGTGNVVHDPLLNRDRTGVELHPENANKLDQLYTAGCIGVDKKQWPHFRELYLKEAEKNGGKLYLTSTREGGVTIGGLPAMAEGGTVTGRSNVPGLSRSMIKVPHTKEQMDTWQPYFSNPLSDIERDMSAARSQARGSISKLSESAGLVGNAINVGKAGWDTFKYAMSPISAVEHTTIGRIAGGAVGGREAGNVVADVLSPFIPWTPSGGVESAVTGAATAAKAVNFLELSQKLERLKFAGKVGESARQGFDKLLGNEVGSGNGKNQIKVVQENAPEGTTVETDGKIFENAEHSQEREITQQPLIEPQVRSRPPDAAKARQKPEETAGAQIAP
jgi:hypothetical protein